MNTIERLKQNEKPFGLMDAEMQEKAREIRGLRNSCDFLKLSTHGQWVDDANLNTFITYLTYRLSADYQEQPEIVEKEVLADSYDGSLYVQRGEDGVSWLYNCLSDPDFIGFKYEGDPSAYAEARRYKDINLSHTYSTWATGRIAITPTHVLFRKNND